MSCCRNGKRRRNNIDKSDTNPVQQDGNQDAVRDRREAERLNIYGRASFKSFVTTIN